MAGRNLHVENWSRQLQTGIMFITDNFFRYISFLTLAGFQTISFFNDYPHNAKSGMTNVEM